MRDHVGRFASAGNFCRDEAAHGRANTLSVRKEYFYQLIYNELESL
jgi:hypothetical protein